MNEADGKIVEGGRFKVYPDGTIERMGKDGLYKKVKLIVSNVGAKHSIRKELQTSYSENGNQTHYYAKKLIADAFVEKKEGHCSIAYKDGNFENINSDNLYWVSKEEIAEKAVETRKENALKPCAGCGVEITSKTGLCVKCTRLKNRKQKNIDAISEVKKRYELVDVESLVGNRKDVLELRLQGCTLEEIGNELGFTRERARQILNSIELDAGIVKSTSRNIPKQYSRRLQTISKKMQKLEKERVLLEKEKEFITNILESIR